MFNAYNINDTIAAVSSGMSPSVKHIVRVSGDKTFDILKKITARDIPNKREIISAPITIAENFRLDARLYLFPSPHSYTGDDLAEIHFFACAPAAELLFSKLLNVGCRAAEAGEFTYRAYANGKMDLSQAEAVAQLVQSSNQYQLSAARQLFSGSIEKKIGLIKQEILELLSLTEAGLDFSAEDIEIITAKKAAEMAEEIRGDLAELLAGSITYEQIMDAPSVIIAGSANAGKSSLVNALIGEQRSIVSQESGTTRDCLQHWLKLDKCDCVLSDTAGLVIEPADVLQTLANAAALNAIENAILVIFCVDITKEDYSEDIKILKTSAWAKAHPTNKKPVIFTATKCDLSKDGEIQRLKQVFGHAFLATSSKTLAGIDKLKEVIQENIISQTAGAAEAAGKTALTERHRQAVIDAINNIQTASAELTEANEEVAAMFLRSALQNLSAFESEYIDEKVLEQIFSCFCIGK